MSTLTIFERQLLANAIAQLETTGLVIVPAEMVNAVWQTFFQTYGALTVEVGVFGSNEHHNPNGVCQCLDHEDSRIACWVRCPELLAKNQARQVEPVEVENDADASALLRTYRTEGLGFSDEAALMGYIYLHHLRG